MFQFSNNPEYVLQYEHKPTGTKFYCPSQVTSYHKSRELAMQAQERFSRCGIDKDTLESFAKQLLEASNKVLAKDTFRSDVAVIANNLIARMKEPVDELCAVRMGAIACFIDGEDPNKVIYAWTEKKMQLALTHPDIYDFFLHMGIAFTPEYAQVLRTLEAEEYFLKRQEMLKGLTIQ